jgi:hypothetical protein
MVLQAIPNVLNGFSGCSSPMDCANKYINDNSATQYAMNKSLHSGGGGRRRRTKRRGLRRFMSYKKNKKGGDDAATDVPSATDAPAQDYYSCEKPDPNFTTVVQFDSNGPDVSPLNSNNSSLDTNTTSIAGQNNALNDCYATGTCPEAACTAAPAQTGGRRFSTRRRKSTRKSKKSRKSRKSKKSKKRNTRRKN